MRGGTRFTVLQPKLWKTSLFSAPKAFRSVQLCPELYSAEFVGKALCGDDLLRLPHSNKVPAPVSIDRIVQDQCSDCRVWLNAWHMEGRPVKALLFHPYVSSDVKPMSTLFGTAPQVFSDAQRLLRTGDFCDTVADKDPSISWLQEPGCGLTRVLHQLLSSDRWRIICKPQSRIVAYYRRICDVLLPPQLMPANNKISSRTIPYMYPTVKE